jgi:hypothetical protein
VAIYRDAEDGGCNSRDFQERGHVDGFTERH